MNLLLSVSSRDSGSRDFWAKELRSVLSGVAGLEVESWKGEGQPGQIVFLDGTTDRALRELDSVLEKIDRRGRAIFLIVKDDRPMPRAATDGRVDDILVHPFRALEALSKLYHYRQILMWNEVSALNSSFTNVIEALREDLKLAERLQKGKLAPRFPDLKQLKASTRYLAGLRSGGDHFDIAESRDGSQVTFLLSDSSSYGLSSAVLATLMRVTVKLSSDEIRSSRETVKRIVDELALTLNEKDKLSVFYGVLSRKDLRLRYVNLGSSSVFHAKKDGEFKELPSQSGPITRAGGAEVPAEAELPISPDDRLVVLSDGFVEVAGGTEATRALLGKFRDREPADLLNELVYQVKARFTEPDDMPEQDCTAAVLDVDSRVLRLAG